MRRVLRTTALFLGLLLAGCTGNEKRISGPPCPKCKYGVVRDKDLPRSHVCVIEGKQVDCTKKPAECPECRMMQ